jgi:hypothetical protein
MNANGLFKSQRPIAACKLLPSRKGASYRLKNDDSVDVADAASGFAGAGGAAGAGAGSSRLLRFEV